jgi:formylglycine-generating enzyme required for sulfatase activity
MLIMRNFILIFLLLFMTVTEVEASQANSSRLQDLTEQTQWINIESVELAIKEMEKNSMFNKSAVQKPLAELKKLVSIGFEGLDKGDTAIIVRAEKALQLYRFILLQHPLLTNAEIYAGRYKLKDARKDMTPKMGTQVNNWSNQQSNAYRGYDAEIVKLSSFLEKTKLSTLYHTEDGAVMADLRMNWQGDRLLFTSVTEDNRLNMYEIPTAETSKADQMIETSEPDLEFYDGLYLPDGRLISVSNIGYQAVPCVHGNDPVGNMVLYDPKTKHLRRLTFDQDANWNPVVCNNGKIMYTRWEYTDLMHYYSRLIMQMNPDGTEQKAIYGSGVAFPNSTFDIQPLPNTTSAFSGIISGHHGVARSGRFILFDPVKGNGVDGMIQEIPYRKRKIDPIVKDRLVDGVWPQFIKPMPINNSCFLVSAKLSPNSLWGIYLVDVFDNMVCLYETEGEGFISPILATKKKTPPSIPDRVILDEKEATVFIQDIYEGEGLRGVPRGVVKSLRLHAYEYAYNLSTSNHEVMGIQSGWDMKRELGIVPLEKDGSAIFKIPANTPISIQPLDKDGRAIQWMRSWLTGMPGEVVSCVGCHEEQNAVAVIPKRVLASTRMPRIITPPKGGTRPFTFDLEVQPVLDRACVSCHDEKHDIDLRRGRYTDRGFKEEHYEAIKGFYRYGLVEFSESYMALHPYVRRQGSEADMAVLQPYEYHANTSELIRMLEIGHHGVVLTEAEWGQLTQWIDYNAPEKGIFPIISPLKGVNQYERRIELNDQYAGGASVNWKKELYDYAKTLKPTNHTTAPSIAKSSTTAKKSTLHIEHWPFLAEEALTRQKKKGVIDRILEIKPGVSIRMKWIPNGEFVMGNDNGALDHQPSHKAKVKEGFWMAETEITNVQYVALVPTHNSRYVDQLWKDHVDYGYPANLPHQPVIRVSYNEATNFCKLLSEKTGQKILLPSEKQWEWACRAGSEEAFWYGDLKADFGTKENLADASLSLMAVKGVDPKPMKKTDAYFNSYNYHPKIAHVDDKEMIQCDSKRYEANPFGLYSMHGNIAEWTRSPYLLYPYNDSQDAERYVVRGGSYLDRPQYAAAYARKAYYPWQRVFNVGFRIIME